MSVIEQFRIDFAALTGNSPFPWQERLFAMMFAGDFPTDCAIPTGLGKTAVIPIWLLALAAKRPAAPAFPRRLVYVVNRQTVVDQATREAENIRNRLHKNIKLRTALQKLCAVRSDSPLAISTLRGQFADNAEWRSDPTRPAIIVGTVDMIGSRLLFSGYGCGFKSRPLHAGFLGQDTLLVHDEAHLEPAFQELIMTVASEQKSPSLRNRGSDYRPMKIMALTATPRISQTTFGLTVADHENEVVKRRIQARKRVSLHIIDDAKRIPDAMIDLALKYKESGKTILIFLRRLDDLEKVAESLRKQKQQFLLLAGTLRGKERDELVQQPIFQRFLSKSNRNSVSLPTGTVYLVCTSAGEVGIDISADCMVCDLAPFDSIAQRFGRVNRYGDGEATIDILYLKELDTNDAYNTRIQKSLLLLQRLEGDGSPEALSTIPQTDRIEASTPLPEIIPATDIHFDAWALTTCRELPGRPPVIDWLHGLAPWEPPQTRIAWRAEVDIFAGKLSNIYTPQDLADMLEDYPLKPHEVLTDRSDRVFRQLEKIAVTLGDKPAWLIGLDGSVRIETLAGLAGLGKDSIDGITLLLPPGAGSLLNGMLNSDSPSAEHGTFDIADEWYADNEKTRRRRQRLWDNEAPPIGMRLVRSIDTDSDIDVDANRDANSTESPSRRFWNWYVLPHSADDDGSKTARDPQELQIHLDLAEKRAVAIVTVLGLPDAEKYAIVFAARHHDLGKNREVWQKSIGNSNYLANPPVVLAKSGGKMRPSNLSNYRHEFGSLSDIRINNDFLALPEETRELVLHLIAAHHGRARPHFSVAEAFDQERSGIESREIADATPQRFARLQRKYGRWGLAYLESLVRASDILASENTQ